ncbi:MAG: hypothetical protein AAFX80_12535, partial [Cyanobacteria bacterium J06639_18]
LILSSSSKPSTPVWLRLWSACHPVKWTSLKDRDRSLLQGLVQGEAPTPADSGITKKLVRKEILEKQGDRYYFQVPLIQKYVEYLVEEEI